MTRTKLLALAAVAGIAAAGGYAVTTNGAPHAPATGAAPTASPMAPTRATQALAPQNPSPLIGTPVALGLGEYRRVQAALRGTVRIDDTAPDPAGGAPWAVRSFQRVGISGHGAVWCTQIGRIVRGRFVWISPGGNRARPIRARIDEDTVCAVASPISDRLGVMVASMPDRDPTEPAAQLEATVIWGSVDRPVRRATVSQNRATLPVTVKGHAFLRVLPGTVPATRARLTVIDANGGTRQAIPPGFFDLQHGAKRQIANTAQPSTLHQLQIVVPGSSDLPSGFFVRYAGNGLGTCYAGPLRAVAGRAVMADRYSGMVRQPQVSCQPMPAEADAMPTGFGGTGWTTGDPVTRGSISATANYRRRVWRRVPPGGGGVLIGVPKGTALLEVRSPVGVKTVRVGPERVTYVGFEGQPEVRDAIFPKITPPKMHRCGPVMCGGPLKITWLEPPLEYRALDAHGRQVGELGSSRPFSERASPNHLPAGTPPEATPTTTTPTTTTPATPRLHSLTG